MVLWGATQSGPTALPGTYQARLTVDGRVQTQSFAVKERAAEVSAAMIDFLRGLSSMR